MLKRLTIPVLAALLVIGSVTLAAAQPDTDGDAAPPLFIVVMDPSADGSGQFTPFSEFDGGSVEVVVDLTDDLSIERILRLDPSPPGGDTFDVRTTGRAVGLRDAVGLQVIDLRWDILNGTGEYEDLTGGGRLVAALEPDESPRISLYRGSTARAIAGSEFAQQNWASIQMRFKIRKLNKRGDDANFTQPSQTKTLKKLRKQNQMDIDFLTELGSQDCYAEAYDALLRMLENVQTGLELKMAFDPSANSVLFGVRDDVEAFDQASDLVRC